MVGGAGTVRGVQVAGELAALANEEGMSVDILLLEQFDHVAPSFPANFQEAVRNQLEKRDIEIRTGTAVERAGDGTITLEGGETLDCDEFVWDGRDSRLRRDGGLPHPRG